MKESTKGKRASQHSKRSGLVISFVLALISLWIVLSGCGGGGGGGGGAKEIPPPKNFAGGWSGTWASTEYPATGGMVSAYFDQEDTALEGSTFLTATALGSIGFRVYGDVTGSSFSAEGAYADYYYRFQGSLGSRTISGTYEAWTPEDVLFDRGTCELTESCDGPVPCLTVDWGGKYHEFIDQDEDPVVLLSDGVAVAAAGIYWDDSGAPHIAALGGPGVDCYNAELMIGAIDWNDSGVIDEDEWFLSVEGWLHICAVKLTTSDLVLDGEPYEGSQSRYVGSGILEESLGIQGEEVIPSNILQKVLTRARQK